MRNRDQVEIAPLALRSLSRGTGRRRGEKYPAHPVGGQVVFVSLGMLWGLDATPFTQRLEREGERSGGCMHDLAVAVV